MSLVKSIPVELNYYIKPVNKTINNKFDDIETIERSFEVKPTYPVDSTNKKRCESAKEWAKTNDYTPYDYQTKTYLPVVPGREGLVIKNIPNIAKSGYKVIGLEYRGEGGRAWKVIDSDNHYFDLREDVLLELIQTQGIKSDGELNGKYLWCVIGSEMKLVRENSSLHKYCIEQDKLKETKIITKFTVGYTYVTRDNIKYIYLGKFNILEKDKYVSKHLFESDYHDFVLYETEFDFETGYNYYKQNNYRSYPYSLNYSYSAIKPSIFIGEFKSNFKVNIEKIKNIYLKLEVEDQINKIYNRTINYLEFKIDVLNDIKNIIYNEFNSSVILNLNEKDKLLDRSNFDTWFDEKYTDAIEKLVLDLNLKVKEYNDKLRLDKLDNNRRWYDKPLNYFK